MPRAKAKGDCFKVAGETIVDAGLASRDDDLVLVHGIVTGQEAIEGVEHWHAWVERTTMLDWPGGTQFPLTTVTDRSNGKDVEGFPAALYYNIGRIEHTWRYTPEEAMVLMVKHGHWGPWVDPEEDKW